MNDCSLRRTAQELVAPGRGILAADESITTMSTRLAAVGAPTSATTRAEWRAVVLTTPGLGDHVSGIILNEETFGQRLSDGRRVPDAATALGILPGVKVDTGVRPLPGHPGETVTEGLDGLADRLEGLRADGARFAKWRAVFRIGSGTPSRAALTANAQSLARYAALCQHADLVPIVEPEVLAEGDHPISRTEAVATLVLHDVMAALMVHGALLEGIVLKPAMVLPGTGCPDRSEPAEVAAATLRTLRRTVIPAVAGVAFLSGGQPPEEAAANLQAMAVEAPHPWALTFSFGRALLDPALRTWQGADANRLAAQQQLHHRLRCTAAARSGAYSPSLESAA